ncbi:hypothetical protein [Tenacibaculum maritimum]|uniref:hypothetical protein n=1 Tax=Tenacibaculum maritimum TaxID=107401 RepID=UPI0038777ABE
MRKSVLLIRGYSKTDIELTNDIKVIQLYIDFFASNAGGAFDLESEIYVLEEPDLKTIRELSFLNSLDYLIVLLLGHGANNQGIQVFQLQEKTFIQPGQIQFDCKKQLHILETCRGIIDFELDIKKINRLVPKYKYGGVFKKPLTREESRKRFDLAIENSEEEVTYLFAASIGEEANDYLFLRLIINVAIYIHEYYRESVVNVEVVFRHAKTKVIEISKGEQTPLKIGEGNLPFVITII